VPPGFRGLGVGELDVVTIEVDELVGIVEEELVEIGVVDKHRCQSFCLRVSIARGRSSTREAWLKTKEYSKGAVLREDMTPLGKDEGEDPELFIEDAEIGDDNVEVEGELYSSTDDDGEECDIVI
jgi:hypothetical protein